MKLLVVSHTEHYLKNGTVVGWGPTVREIDHLANLFDEIIHIAMLHTGPAPDSAIAYQSPRVKLCPVPVRWRERPHGQTPHHGDHPGLHSQISSRASNRRTSSMSDVPPT
jgi:hypothetical protein